MWFLGPFRRRQQYTPLGYSFYLVLSGLLEVPAARAGAWAGVAVPAVPAA